MKGNKINCNVTSDDSVANLRLNPAGNIEVSNVILPAVGADLYRPSGNTSYNLRIRDLQGIWEFRNRTLTCRNASNENLATLMEIQSLGQGQIRLGTASTAQVGVGANPNASYFLTVAGTSNFDVIRSATGLDLMGDMYVKGTGSDIVRPSGDANYTLRVRDTQAVWEFRNRNFRCMNPSNPATGTEMILHDTGGDYRLRIGSTSDAEVGIGRQYNSSYFLTVGGMVRSLILFVSAPDATEMLISCSCLAAAGDSIDFFSVLPPAIPYLHLSVEFRVALPHGWVWTWVSSHPCTHAVVLHQQVLSTPPLCPSSVVC